MNPRLRDLQIQAFAECKKFEDGQFRTDEVFQRFAELIVRECLEKIYSVTIDNPTDDWDQGYDSGLEQAADTIKTHFGVSE